MKKKIVVILLVICILCCIFYFFYNKDRIKKGDTFINVTFKEEIPIIKSSKKACIMIKDIKSNVTYTIYYEKIVSDRPLIHFVKESDNEYLSYVYSWDELPQQDSYIHIPKGWSVHKDDKIHLNSYSSISYNKIGTITGEVVVTEGNTAILKEIFNDT